MRQKLSRGSMVIPVVFLGIIMLGMIGFIVYKSMTSKVPTQLPSEPTEKVTSVQSQPTKDFAPNLPMNQKSTIIIRLSDSSTIKYIVPKDQVDTYVQHLPQGYTVVSASN